MSRQQLTVWDGVAITIGGLALFAVLGVALATPHFEEMFKEMGHARLPRLTRFVLSGGATLRLGVPAVLVAAFVATFVRRPPIALRLVLAVITVVVASVWLFALYAPILALAGSIQ